jgi:hypothetical protein
VRRLVLGTSVIALGFVTVVGCDNPALGPVSQLPDPALHTVSPKKVEPARIPIVIKPKVQQKAIPGEPGWMPASGISNRWECIIIHHSDSANGSAASFDAWHRQRGWDELGYHFVIDNGSGGPDGRVEVGSRWNTQKHGAHCKVPGNYYNEHGIGICLVGDFERSRPTAKQVESMRKLLAFLMSQTHVPASHVLGHREANGNQTRCPGRYMDMVALRASLGGGPQPVAYGK